MHAIVACYDIGCTFIGWSNGALSYLRSLSRLIHRLIKRAPWQIYTEPSYPGDTTVHLAFLRGQIHFIASLFFTLQFCCARCACFVWSAAYHQSLCASPALAKTLEVFLVSFTIWLIATLLGKSWRIVIDDPGQQQPSATCTDATIYCFWHEHLLPISCIFRNTGITAVVSRSNDGQLAAEVAKRWQHAIIYGSSSRGGASALRQSLRVLKRGSSLAITPDGPRGPRHEAKAGVAQLAAVANVPVTTLSIRASRYWQLNTWDHFLIPKPFATVTVTVGTPLQVVAGLSSDATTAHLQQQIKERLCADDSLAS